MRTRILFALPFALHASIIGACSSSSSTGTDAGPKADTGTKHSDAKADTKTTPKTDAGASSSGAGNSSSSGAGTSSSGGGNSSSGGGNSSSGSGSGTGPTPAPGSTQIAAGVIDVIGVTGDDQVAYQDCSTWAVSVSDATGTKTPVTQPIADGGMPPNPFVAGKFVFVTTDYTVYTSGSSELIGSGTLSVWSKTLGSLKQLATNAWGPLNVATDSSYIVYVDKANADGTVGSIAVVAGDTTGATDLVTNVVTDESSTTCAPLALFSGKYVVLSYCPIADGGAIGAPQIASFDSSNSWAKKVLVTNAGTSSPYVAPGLTNFTVDTLGDNVLTIGGGTGDGGTTGLYSQGTTSATPRTAMAPFGVPVNSAGTGTEFFYLSTQSTFAFFTDPTAGLQKWTYASPTTAPVAGTALAAAGDVLGIQSISPDENWDVDYSTATDPSTGAPTSLNLRNLSTGAVWPLIPSGSGLALTIGSANSFTADHNYVIFSTNLTAVTLPGSTGASVGTLKTAAVATGDINAIVPGPNATVWDWTPLTGSGVLYNQNYKPIVGTISTLTSMPNGSASGDVYVADASKAAEGALLVTGADAANDFYTTSDKAHLFYTFSQVTTGDGGAVIPSKGDGLYVVAIP